MPKFDFTIIKDTILYQTHCLILCLLITLRAVVSEMISIIMSLIFILGIIILAIHIIVVVPIYDALDALFE